jgi:dynein heavy chain
LIRLGEKLLDILMEYDTENIPEEAMNKVRKNYIAKKDLFNPARIKKASEACVSICKWVIALSEYEKVIFVSKKN